MAFSDVNNAKVFFRQGGEEFVESRGGSILREVHEVAALGSTQADAPQISGHFNFITNANGTMGVKLPTAKEGKSVWVYNMSDFEVSGLKVYPTGVNCRINSLAAQSGAFYIPGGSGVGCQFVATSATQWYARL